MVAREATGIIKAAKLFTGIEQEGPLNGMPTLFVADAELSWAQCRTWVKPHVYFGACRLSPVSLQAVREASVDPSVQHITVETPIAAIAIEVAAILKAASAGKTCRVVYTTLMVWPNGARLTVSLDAAYYSWVEQVKETTEVLLKTDDGYTVRLRSVNTCAEYITVLSEADYSSDVQLI